MSQVQVEHIDYAEQVVKITLDHDSGAISLPYQRMAQKVINVPEEWLKR